MPAKAGTFLGGALPVERALLTKIPACEPVKQLP
jgi:hypothetical protein